MSVVEDIGQGLMDEIQTPEGIASVAGGTVGTLAGGYAGSRVNSALKADMEYSPIHNSTLGKVENSFNGGTFTRKYLKEDTVMYRVHGGKAGKVGSYMSRTPQGGGLQSQLDLALNPSWGNTTEHVSKVVVPKGTKIYEGVAAPQNILDSRGNIIGVLPGGGNQIYIPKVKTRWFK